MLNPQQQAVVEHGSGPLLVVAGAGTGKTTVMAHRAAALVARGTAPDRLLLLTFTRRSAEELKRRTSLVLNRGTLALPWCGTFHGISARLLRRYGVHVGLNPNFSIYDESDTRDLLGTIADELFPERVKEAFPAKGALYRLYSFHANTEKPLIEVIRERYPAHESAADQLQAIFAAYGERKRAAAALDFDDLLLRWLDLLQATTFDCAALFDSVMVDEYQDTNLPQARILQALCRRHREIMVVGDDAQAIYAFRGATIENILRFEEQFSRVIRLNLEENYRSSQEILDAANALWDQAEQGFKKRLTAASGAGDRPLLETCENDWDQAEKVIGHIAQAWHEQHVPLTEQAVLFRSSQHSFRLEALLQKNRIPFRKYGGQRFADSAHIKDVFAFLRLRENPGDEAAWHRVLGLLPGIGPATARRFARDLLTSTAPADTAAALRFPKAAEPLKEGFAGLLRQQFTSTLALAEELQAIFAFYQPLLARLYDGPQNREAGLQELLVLAGNYETRRQMLDEMLVGDDSLVEEAEGAANNEFLTISTIHSAKGCEWRNVYVLQLVEGGIPAGPSQEDPTRVEEERRLLYVAMTRARERLILFQPKWREGGDRSHYERAIYRPSRFLTPEVVACLDTPTGDCAADPVYEPLDDDAPTPPSRHPTRRSIRF